MSNSSTIFQEYRFILSDFVIINKYVDIATIDAFSDLLSEVQWSFSSADSLRFDVLIIEHRQEWEDLWLSADIEILEDKEVQLSVRSSLFHLWNNIRNGNERCEIEDTSIAPVDLINDSYTGQMFLLGTILMIDLLKCRYFYISKFPHFDPEICPFHTELSRKESGRDDWKCQIVQ